MPSFRIKDPNGFNLSKPALISRDDHRFSLLHWAAREGRDNIVDMLIKRGARINATNMGDDTPIHLAAAHGHRDVTLMVSQLQKTKFLFLVPNYNGRKAIK